MIAGPNPITTDSSCDIHPETLAHIALKHLPPNLDEIAKSTGALGFRDHAKIKTPLQLLQLIFSYTLTDMSLESTTDAFASTCALSSPALLYRLRRSTPFLAHLLAHLLATSMPPLQVEPVLEGLTLMLLDGWSATDQSAEAGAHANNARHHVLIAMTLADLTIRQIVYDLERPNTGESYKYIDLAPHQLWISDASFTRTSAFDLLEAHQSYLLGYYNPTINLYKESTGDERIDLPQLLSDNLAQPGDQGEWQVWVNSSRGDSGASRRPLRLLAQRLTEQTTARRNAERRRKKGSQASRQVALDRYVTLLSNLEPGRGSTAALLDFYRMRWQVELELKREQSLIQMERIPTRTPASTQFWLLAKLLAVTLVHRMLSVLETTAQGGSCAQVPALDTSRLQPNPLSRASLGKERTSKSQKIKSRQETCPESSLEDVWTQGESSAAQAGYLSSTRKARWAFRLWKWGWHVLLNLWVKISTSTLEDSFSALYHRLSRAETSKHRLKNAFFRLDPAFPHPGSRPPSKEAPPPKPPHDTNALDRTHHSLHPMAGIA